MSGTVLLIFIFRSVWCYLSINNSSFDDNNYSVKKMRKDVKCYARVEQR